MNSNTLYTCMCCRSRCLFVLHAEMNLANGKSHLVFTPLKYYKSARRVNNFSKGGTSDAQNIVDQVVTWSSNNRVHLNQDKCKELRISFVNQPAIFHPLTINGKELEVVKTVKLLGRTVKDNLAWNSHVDEVIKKVNNCTF